MGAKPQMASPISEMVSRACRELSRGSGYLDLGSGIGAGINYDGEV